MDGGSAGEEATITIDDFTFSPAELEASPGQTVRVINNDSVAHTVTSESAPNAFDDTSDEELGFDTGLLSSGEETTFEIPSTAEVGDELYFYCIPHQGTMATPNGTIRIVAGEEVTITIDDFTFSPVELEASPGQTVRVINNDSVAHTVTSESAPNAFDDTSDEALGFDTGLLSSGAEATFEIPAAAAVGDVLYYYCIPHQGTMVTPNGMIHIVENASETEDEETESNPTVSFTASSQSSTGESGTMTVTAQLSATSGLDVTVPFTVTGTATGGGTDYSITVSPVTINAGASSVDVTITISGDSLDEANETVIVTMGSPTNATQGATTVHTAAITDDDGVPTVRFSTASQSSSGESGTMTVTAQLSNITALDVTVPFTVTGTATGGGTDYSITSSPITIGAGSTTGSATITITADSSHESNETVIVTMGSPTNATQGTTTVHTATITDDDPLPELTLTIVNPLTYSPVQFDAQAGQTVRVINNDNFPHTVTSESAPNAFDNTSGTSLGFDTGTINAGAQKTFTIPSAAVSGQTLYFYCIPHQGNMTTPNGTINIVAN